YSAQTLTELDITAELVTALYANLDDFQMFRQLTFLYFGASMYAETMRRLGRPERAPSFLLHEDPAFGPALRRCVREAADPAKGAERKGLVETIRNAVEPFNLAALGDPGRRHWYPARAADLMAAASKLEVSPAELEQLLARWGFSSR